MIGAIIGNRAGFVEAAGTGQGAEDVAKSSAQSRAEIGGEIEAIARHKGDAVERERKRVVIGGRRIVIPLIAKRQPQLHAS